LAGEFLEILYFADLIHLIDDSIQDGLDVFIRLFLEEWSLAFQARLMAEKLFLVKGRDLPFSTLCH
jgi:hypothetical protein